MTAKEYLSQAHNIELKIKRMKEEVEEYKRLAESIPGCDFSAIRVSATRNNEAPFVKWIMRQFDKEKEIELLEDKLSNIKSDILLTIDKLENSNHRMVLVYRYLEWLSWEEIGNKIYVSRTTVKRILNKAIELIKVDPL